MGGDGVGVGYGREGMGWDGRMDDEVLVDSRVENMAVEEKRSREMLRG